MTPTSEVGSAFQPSRTVRSDSVLKDQALPFLGASFAADLALFLALWPVWWLLGVEQLIPPLFVAWELLLYFLRTNGSLNLEAPVLWSLLNSIWFLAPISWVPPEELDFFARGAAMIFAQTVILFLFSHEVKSEADRMVVLRGLGALSLAVVGGTLIALIGGPTAQIPSALGLVLPEGLTSSSEFWGSLAIRRVTAWGGGWFPFRISSIALKPSALSSVCLVLIPLTVLGMRTSSSTRRSVARLTLAGLVFSLIATESRAAHVAAVCGIISYLVLRARRGALAARLLPLVPVLLVALSVGVMILLSGRGLPLGAEETITSLRPESWKVRSQIYRETYNLLLEHPLAGWGVAMPIPGMARVYSAGSHSGFLSALFQHGAVGLLLYLGLWMSVLHRLGGRFTKCPPEDRRHLAVLAATLVAVLIREVADGWNWDFTSAIVVWSAWGMSMMRTPTPVAQTNS